MKYQATLIAALTLLSGTAAFAQSDAVPGTPTGRPDDETAVTKSASNSNLGQTQYQNQGPSGELSDAYKDYQANKYASAQAKLEAIVKKSPKDAQAQELLAYCDLKLNKPDDAALHLAAYTQLKPNDLQARANLGQVYMQTNHPTDAIPQYQAVLAKSPKDAQAQFGLAVALSSSGQNAQAADAFGKATVLDPKNANAWLDAGLLYAQTGAPDKAIPALKQALALKADNPYDTHLALAQSYEAAKDNASAMKELQAAAQLKPGEATPLFNLAVLEQQSGDTAGAEASYQKVLALKPTDPNLLNPAQSNLGLLLAKDGTPDTAIPALTQAAASDPTNADVQSALGLMYLKQGKKDDAKAAYQKALTIDPTRADAKAGLAAASH